MGEEKPDEELMGKRKSSPRLSTTLVMSIITEWPGSFLFIHVASINYFLEFMNSVSSEEGTARICQ